MNKVVELSNYKNIHCIGIGGIGLSAIAEILIDRGHIVTGSDIKKNDVTDRLEEKGVNIFFEHLADNVKCSNLVIYSSAVGNDNQELTYARKMGIPIMNRAEILGILMSDYKNSIAVSGTHGKTTTTSMISLILENAKKEPTILVGGNLAEIKGNVKVGGSDFFVTEACEYMDSFLELKPKIEIILNIDSDHLDYFKDIDHIVKSFQKFTELVGEDGVVIAYDANPFVNNAVKNKSKVITFGLNDNSTYYATDIEFNDKGIPKFNVFSGKKKLSEMKLAMPGEHNILNALAAFACCHYLGIETECIKNTLAKYKGTQRRFDIVGALKNNVQIVDDYAHHPTEIKATLSAAKKINHNKLWCVFQPHTYTRTIALFDDFRESFDNADIVIFAEIYAAREKNIHKISSENLALSLKEKYPEKEVYYMETFEKIAGFLYENAQDNDLMICMGAGDIYKVAEMVLNKEEGM